METLFRFFVQHPLLPIAILLVSVLAGFLFLLRNKEFFPGEGGLRIPDEPEDSGGPAGVPIVNDPWGDALIALERGEWETLNSPVNLRDVQTYLRQSMFELETAVNGGHVPNKDELLKVELRQTKLATFFQKMDKAVSEAKRKYRNEQGPSPSMDV